MLREAALERLQREEILVRRLREQHQQLELQRSSLSAAARAPDLDHLQGLLSTRSLMAGGSLFSLGLGQQLQQPLQHQFQLPQHRQLEPLQRIERQQQLPPGGSAPASNLYTTASRAINRQDHSTEAKQDDNAAGDALVASWNELIRRQRR